MIHIYTSLSLHHTFINCNWLFCERRLFCRKVWTTPPGTAIIMKVSVWLLEFETKRSVERKRVDESLGIKEVGKKYELS